ncbi:MAG: MATE family efflux transporter [Bacteroidaceae bacterium]|nr:MATE family efflux transporter [Bacteroidaceae bacterium]
MIRNGESMTFRQQLKLTAILSIPAFFAQISSIIMQYIDAAMVGSLGAAPSASIGLVSTSTWLFGSLCGAVSTGFSVQVAHLIGGNQMASARSVLRQALFSALIFGLTVAAIGISISSHLPHWLGGGPDITEDASRYFLIFTCTIPFFQLSWLGASMLRCSGNLLTPSLLGILTCILDVVFNFLFIFPTRNIDLWGLSITIPGADLGVTGAALGTALAEVVVCSLMLFFLCLRSPLLKLTQDQGCYLPQRATLKKATHIGLPIGIEHFVMCGAQIMTTVIVAPLGTIAIAANAFAITAESLCYMPGYGIAEAATTLVGQSTGAGRPELMKRFANITVGLGMIVMTLMGIIMYIGAPLMMSMLTPVAEVQSLGVSALRIEAWAEPMFAASIVAYSVFVGVGDTVMPAAMNLISIWAVRLSLAAVLAPRYGLNGVWIAMCIELCFRGMIFLIRLKWGHWEKKGIKKQSAI